LNGLSITSDLDGLMDGEFVEFVETSRIQLKLDLFIFEIDKNPRVSYRFNRSNGSNNLLTKINVKYLI